METIDLTSYYEFLAQRDAFIAECCEMSDEQLLDIARAFGGKIANYIYSELYDVE